MEKKQLNLESFKSKFGGWWKYMEKYIAGEEFYDTFQKIKKDATKEKVFPKSADTFKCFELCKPEYLKVLIFGMEPYSGEFYDNKLPQADGLCLSNSYSNGKLQPSLSSFFEGISNEYETDIDQFLTKDLSYLATQGVFLANRSLVVKKGKIGSCLTYFDSFWKYFFEEVITPFFPSIPVLFLGNDSLFLKRYVFEMATPVFKIDHPSFANRTGQTYDTQNSFHKINNHIRSTIGDKFEIKWNYTEYTKWISEPPF